MVGVGALAGLCDYPFHALKSAVLNAGFADRGKHIQKAAEGSRLAACRRRRAYAVLGHMGGVMALSLAAVETHDAVINRAGNRIATVAAVILLSLAVLANMKPFAFTPLTLEQVGNFLGRIFLVALVFERALEVIITTWRGPTAAALEATVSAASAQKLSLDDPKRALAPTQAERDTALVAVTRAEESLAGYRATTQRMALWTAFVLGIALSAVGIRMLDPLLQTSSATGLQQSVFASLDALLSGATIAGGSEGIHKITQAFQDFFEAGSKRAKAAGNS